MEFVRIEEYFLHNKARIIDIIKDLDVNDAWVVDLQTSLLEEFTRGLKMEGEAE